jgi:hypothetical protein
MGAATAQSTARQRIRFAVRSQDRRSSTFVLTTGKRRSDVYLAAREIGGTIKASFHESGDCRIAFTSEYVERNGRLVPESGRVVTRWRRPIDQEVGVAQVCAIVVPSGGVLVPIGDESQYPSGFRWYPCPDALATQFSVFIATPNTEASPADRLKLIGQLQLVNGETVLLTAHPLHDPGNLPRTIPAPPLSEEVRERLASAPPGAVRIFLVGGPHKSGYCWIMDAAVTYNPPA